MTPSVERLRCAFDQSSSTHPSQRTLMAWLTSNETARGFLRASSTKPCWRFQRRSSRTGGDTAKSLGSPIAVVCSTYSTCSHNPTPGSFPTYSPYTRQRLSGSSGLPMKARPPWSVSHTVYFRFFSIVSLTRVLLLHGGDGTVPFGPCASSTARVIGFPAVRAHSTSRRR